MFVSLRMICGEIWHDEWLRMTFVSCRNDAMDAKFVQNCRNDEIIDGDMLCVYGRARREAGQFEMYLETQINRSRRGDYESLRSHLLFINISGTLPVFPCPPPSMLAVV